MKLICFGFYIWLGFKFDMLGIKLIGSYKEIFLRVYIEKVIIVGIYMKCN